MKLKADYSESETGCLLGTLDYFRVIASISQSTFSLANSALVGIITFFL